MIILIIFTILCITQITPATGVSTIKAGEQLNRTSNLFSPGNNFTLGFFTISATNFTYLGIWYTTDDQLRKVWVAKPSTPIVSSSSVLTIDPVTGKLTISDGGNTVLANISDNRSGSGLNLAVTLQDTGNFQLKNETDNTILWQSFDHPTNVLLPGMKLGTDLKTGRIWNLTSWMSDQIPDSGPFTLSWEPNGLNSQRFMIRQRGQPYWTSGDLRNQDFEFMSINSLPPSYNLTSVYNNEERFFSFESVNYLNPMWVLRTHGRIVDGNDRRLVSTPDFCYGYDLGNGCVARSDNNPRCRSEDDFFSHMNGDFAPELTTTSVNDNSSISISDCMAICWNDCRCLGLKAGGNGTGCLTWNGIKSINNFSVDSQKNATTKYVLISPNSSKGNAKTWIWAPIAAPLVLILFFFGLLWYLKNQKHRREVKTHERDDRHFLEMMASENSPDINNHGRKGSDMTIFSYASIVTATNDFSNENKLGRGGFGPVYKGKLSNEQEIAIKRLSRTSTQGLVEFKNELLLITQLQHRNLVRVLGCCIHEDEKMLVYEYMPNKSLNFFLFDADRKTLLDWPKRWYIIEGIAQGLLYLHKYSRMRVIHRDLKSDNVLLDENMNPKISDFGMARIFEQNETEAITKRVVGTYGYMSPEYAMEGTFSEKSDVFSFGVILLEIVSGRRNSIGAVNLVREAWELWQQGDPLALQDPTLADTCVVDQLLRTIHVALLCVQESAMDRSLMAEVVSMLSNETMALPAPRRSAFLFDRTESTPTSTERKSEECSLNKITITEMVAR